MQSKSEFLSLYSTVLIVKSFEFDVRNGNWFLQSVVRSCVLSGNGQVSVYGNQVSRVLNMMVWLHWTIQSGNTVLILIMSFSDEFLMSSGGECRWWVQVIGSVMYKPKEYKWWVSSSEEFNDEINDEINDEFSWWVQDEFKMSSSNEFK